MINNFLTLNCALIADFVIGKLFILLKNILKISKRIFLKRKLWIRNGGCIINNISIDLKKECKINVNYYVIKNKFINNFS